MFLVRHAIQEDAPTLLRLAKTVHSGNLPRDADALHDRIQLSIDSFAGRRLDGPATYMFVVVDLENDRVAGTSSLVTGKGTTGHPRLFLRVRRREHYSDDLQAGQVQMTVQLGEDRSGPTELGGLVLSSSYRGGVNRLGSLLSKIRFAYVGMHPERFNRRLIGEIMGDLTADGRTMLWDHLGRRFINLSYMEADAFSRTSKEFITSLFPKDEIYVSLLPAEARRLIGRVSPAAVPAMRMLERQGFCHSDEVDPFDGGPYVEAERDEIPLVRGTTRRTVDAIGEVSADAADCLVCVSSKNGFAAMRCPIGQGLGGGVVLTEAVAGALGVEARDEVGVTVTSPSAPS
jgi:arginine N-succinyltransferase